MMHSFFRKKKKLQSSLEEWEHIGREKLAEEAAANKDNVIRLTIESDVDQLMNDHPLARQVYEKREAYQRAQDALNHAKASLSGGQAEAMQADLQAQFEGNSGKQHQEEIMHNVMRDQYAVLLERMQNIENTLSEIQSNTQDRSEAEPMQEEHGMRTMEDILQDARSNDRHPIAVCDQYDYGAGYESESEP